ncbi:hypothetical protein LMG26857_03344 [Achromobacter anxifer]|uniref:hypothetical protein n=1 Tax=Achromobacter anxifer TaxID=1287737 RepID=UPI00155C9BDF|nr:hypothetical protein [Achromobacter anxifer]CAB5514285.1 hypothetical protein LMG26857_03344 [Achromobacter anxifer]
MTIECIHQVALECRSGTSDKVYVIQVQKDTTGPIPNFRTCGYSGRRGGRLTEQEKYNGPSEASALAKANSVERDKRTGSSRYTTMAVSAGATIAGMPSGVPVFGGASVPGTPSASTAAPAAIGPTPKKAKVAAAAEIVVFNASSDWATQRKYDGERCVMSLRRGQIVGFNLKGMQMSVSAKVEKEFEALLTQPDFNNARETVLDGELMGDVYVAYDILTLRNNDMRDMPFAERFSALELLLDSNLGLLAETAWSESEKAAMRARAEAEAWEGLMHLDVDALYLAGVSDAIKKEKFWESCTCRVLTVNSKRSVQIALRDDDGEEIPAGNVTIPVSYPLPEADDLIEVKYLYAHPGGSLYQPVYLGKRDDKDECDLRSSIRCAPPEKTGGSAVSSPAPAATATATASATPAVTKVGGSAALGALLTKAAAPGVLPENVNVNLVQVAEALTSDDYDASNDI